MNDLRDRLRTYQDYTPPRQQPVQRTEPELEVDPLFEAIDSSLFELPKRKKKKRKKKSGKKILVWLLFVLILAVSGGVGYARKSCFFFCSAVHS